jgi:predicted regulator of Ras-like GTPase activity (Roadblock/LC7/MglB family)
LNELCETYGFTAAILVGSEGLPVAAAIAEPDVNTDKLAAVVAHMRSCVETAERQLGWSGLDEVNIVSKSGSRLLGRVAELGEEEFILVLLMPYWMSYRKATTQALGVIRWAWQETTSE